MITLNGAIFGSGPKSLTNDMTGFYRRFPRSLVLFNREGLRIGVINRHGVLCRAKMMSDGKWWYSYGDVDGIGRWERYSEQVEQCLAALSDTENQAIRRGRTV